MTIQLLRERGYGRVRAFASGRSVGRQLDGGLVVEEATPDALEAGDIDIAFFSVGTSASREHVPHACGAEPSRWTIHRPPPAGRNSAGRPEVNGERALEHDGILANRNCCTIPLTMTLKPLHDAAGLARVRVANGRP